MSEAPPETPLLDLLSNMTADSLAASDLDPRTLMLVRIAALAAVDAPPLSYVMNLGVAGEVGVESEQIRDVLAAIAPIVGTARIGSAVATMVEALAITVDAAMLDEAIHDAESAEDNRQSAEHKPD
jgi:4-carboxymuconolactone decarboxylase